MSLNSLLIKPKQRSLKFAERPIGRRDISDDEWIETLKEGDYSELHFKDIIRRCMQRMHDDVRLEDLEEGFTKGHYEDVLAALPTEKWTRRWETYISPWVYHTMVTAAEYERRRLFLYHHVNAEHMGDRAHDIANQLAHTVVTQTVEAIEYLAKDLLGERHRIYQANRQGFAAPKQRVTPDVAAIITRDGIGMNRRQIAGYGNRINQGIDEDRDPLDVKEENNWYVDRQWDTRTAQIARTQAMFAVNEGEYQQWQQAYDKGEFDRDKTWLYWIAIGDDKVCAECNALDGTRRKLNNDFNGATHPPIHPGCRCVLTINEPASTYRQRENKAVRSLGDVKIRDNTGVDWTTFRDRLDQYDNRAKMVREYDKQMIQIENWLNSTEASIAQTREHIDEFSRETGMTRDEAWDWIREHESWFWNEYMETFEDLGDLAFMKQHFEEQRWWLIADLYGSSDSMLEDTLWVRAMNLRRSGMPKSKPIERHNFSEGEMNALDMVFGVVERMLPLPGNIHTPSFRVDWDETIWDYAQAAYLGNGHVKIAGAMEYSRDMKLALAHEIAHWYDEQSGMEQKLENMRFYDYYMDLSGTGYLTPHDFWMNTQPATKHTVVKKSVKVPLRINMAQDYARTYYHDGDSELFSTGLEQLLIDPLGFQTIAPEHYEYTVWVLEGRPVSENGMPLWMEKDINSRRY